jgi:hypothetical protein
MDISHNGIPEIAKFCLELARLQVVEQGGDVGSICQVYTIMTLGNQ